MHFSNLVIVESGKPKNGNIKGAVEELLKNGKDDWWDFWQIGGRWTGMFDGYDPEKDSVNIETCNLCGGTGTRKDMQVSNGCNGCQGKGIRVKWPTEWAQHPGDIMPIENLTKEHLDKFYRVIVPYHAPFTSERYEPWREKPESMFPKQAMPSIEWLKKEFAGYICVVVDNHN